MHYFRFVGGQLCCEGVSLAQIARRFSTPLYVYSQATIVNHFQKLQTAFNGTDHLICYAVKANSNLSILRLLASLGSGFDVVSMGELCRVLEAGGDANKCVFAGVGKSSEEILFALKRGIYCFNVESEPELERINKLARKMRRMAPVAIRINPNVDPHTHAKITTGTSENKFGIPFEQAEEIYKRASRMPNILLRGVHMHIGSQICSVDPFEAAVRKMIPLVAYLKKEYQIDFFSLGGGIGIVYDPALVSGQPQWWEREEAKKILTPQTYAQRLLPLLKPLQMRIILEPGRFIVGNAGVLLTKVEYVKRTPSKTFVVVDAAMSDLIRPALYDAYHEIVPVRKRRARMIKVDVVGPVCETSDTFCRDRKLPRLVEGDLLAIMSAGAYGFAMASNYNSRPLPAEVLVNGQRVALVRARQRVEELWAGEAIAPWLK